MSKKPVVVDCKLKPQPRAQFQNGSRAEPPERLCHHERLHHHEKLPVVRAVVKTTHYIGANGSYPNHLDCDWNLYERQRYARIVWRNIIVGMRAPTRAVPFVNCHITVFFANAIICNWWSTLGFHRIQSMFCESSSQTSQTRAAPIIIIEHSSTGQCIERPMSVSFDESVVSKKEKYSATLCEYSVSRLRAV